VNALIPLRDDNPYSRFPIMTIALIVANTVIFFATSFSVAGRASGAFVYRYGLVPCNLAGHCPVFPPQIQTLLAERSPWASMFTAMFMHANILHLGFNMLFLWIFGNNVEDRLGRIRFLIFYFVCGIGAALFYIVFNVNSAVPVIGASGAISGILGAYVLIWPRARVLSLVPLGFFFFPIRTPAFVVIGLWFVGQLLAAVGGYATHQQSSGGVAFLAHIGGFLVGLLLIVPFGGRRTPRGVLYHGVG
jgi:membrane associated rhomboid family serine protease